MTSQQKLYGTNQRISKMCCAKQMSEIWRKKVHDSEV